MMRSAFILREVQNVEMATGCRRTGALSLYQKGHTTELDVAEAGMLLHEGATLVVVNAGAGCFWNVMPTLGYEVMEVVDQTSSAGNWAIRLKGGGVLYQTKVDAGYEYYIEIR